MQSTIRIDFADLGFGRGLEPIIRVKAITTDDPRDQLIKTLFQSTEFLEVQFTENTEKKNAETGLSETDSRIILHKPKQPIKSDYINVYGNSHAFHAFLDKEGIDYRPNEHFTLIDVKVDLFDLGQKFQKYKDENQGKA